MPRPSGGGEYAGLGGGQGPPRPQPPDHLAVALSHREIFTVSKSDGTQSSTARKGRQGTMPGREFALHQANTKVCNLLLTAEEE